VVAAVLGGEIGERLDPRFIGKIADEAGIKHPTQVRRIFRKIVEMGAFRRPAGKKGFKKIYGKNACRFFRSTGKEIIEHALRNDLVSPQRLREIELRCAQDEIDAEAALAEAAQGCTDDTQLADIARLEDVPETIGDLTDREKGDTALLTCPGRRPSHLAQMGPKLCDNLVLNKVSNRKISSLLTRARGSDRHVG
jgi:hypothetical protein